MDSLKTASLVMVRPRRCLIPTSYSMENFQISRTIDQKREANPFVDRRKDIYIFVAKWWYTEAELVVLSLRSSCKTLVVQLGTCRMTSVGLQDRPSLIYYFLRPVADKLRQNNFFKRSGTSWMTWICKVRSMASQVQQSAWKRSRWLEWLMLSLKCLVVRIGLTVVTDVNNSLKIFQIT